MPAFIRPCKNVYRYLWDYAGENLSEAERARVETHLRDCPACAEQVEAYRRTVALMQAGQNLPLSDPGATWNALESRIEQERTPVAPPSRQSMGYALAWRGAALAVLLLVTWGVLHTRHGSGGPTPDIRQAQGGVNRLSSPSLHPEPTLRQARGNTLSPTSGGRKTVDLHKTPAEHRNVKKSLAELGPHNPPRQERSVAIQREKPAITEEPGQSLLPGLSTSQPVQDDLAYLNSDPALSPAITSRLRPQEASAVSERLLQSVKFGDDFVTLPPPQIAGRGTPSIRAALAAYKQEAAIVDARLVYKVNLGVKGIAFSDLCKRLRAETGIELTANRKVGDDKITIFCTKRPLRDLMRQISRLFGFTWIRTGEEGVFRYELTQTLRAQLMEEELRNRDRDEALLALDRQMEKYRKYVGLSPEQMRAVRNDIVAESGGPGEFQTQRAYGEWIGANLYFGLSREELDSLRSGQPLTLDSALEPGPRALSPDSMHALLECFDAMRYSRHPKNGPPLDSARNLPEGVPLSAAPGVHMTNSLELDIKQLGRFTLSNHIFVSVTEDGGTNGTGIGIPLAEGVSPAIGKPQNALANAKLAQYPALQALVTLQPKASCQLVRGNYPNTDGALDEPGPKVTTGDVLEAVFKATGKDVIGDYYTRLTTPEAVSVRSVRLFDALNQVSDTLRARWSRQDDWLQFRSVSFFYDRLQEVPNRLLARWADSRREHGALTLDDLAEIAQLSDRQLDAIPTAQGAMACYQLQEWPLARSEQLRAHWRFLATLSPSLRRAAGSEQGLTFVQIPASQKKAFLELALGEEADTLRLGLFALEGTLLRVEYSLPEPTSEKPRKAPALLGNPVTFAYMVGKPGDERRINLIGPFNAITGLSEAMYRQRGKQGL